MTSEARYIKCGKCGAETLESHLQHFKRCGVCRHPVYLNVRGAVRLCHNSDCYRTANGDYRGARCVQCQVRRREKQAATAAQGKCKGCGNCMPLARKGLDYCERCETAPEPAQVSDLVPVMRNQRTGEAWVPLDEYLRVLQLAKDAGLEV